MPKKSLKKNFIKKDSFRKFLYVSTIIAAVLFFFISNKARAAVFISIFIVLNRIITTYKVFIRLPLEFEFLTLGIVLTTLEFGAKAGLIVAVFGCILSFIVGFPFSTNSFPMFVGYASIAGMTFLLRDFNVTVIGLIVTLINNIIVFFQYSYLFGYDPVRNLGFSISNMLFNAVLFYNFAPLLLSLI